MISFKEGIEMKRLQYPGPTKVMTVRELSDYLHSHPSTIYRLVKRHEIPRLTWLATGASTSRKSIAGACSKRTSSHAGIPANNFLARQCLKLKGEVA
jgi:IS30 family transposase